MPFARLNPLKPLARAVLCGMLLMGAFLSCAAPFLANLRPLREQENVIVYALSADRFPADESVRKQMAPVRRLPSLSVPQIRGLLGNVEYRKETIWGVVEGRVFQARELDFVASAVAEAIPHLGDRDRLVVISRFDPDAAVLSRLERVSVLVWADEANIHVVFGEIRYEIPHNDYYEIQDWAQILPISLKQSFPYYSLVPSADFTLKKVNGFTHETWAVFDIKSVPTLAYVPPDRIKQSDRGRRDFGDRRRILRKMKDAGIVSADEFALREKAIVRDEKRQLLRDALDSGVLSQDDYDRKILELDGAKGETKEPDAATKKEGPPEGKDAGKKEGPPPAKDEPAPAAKDGPPPPEAR